MRRHRHALLAGLLCAARALAAADPLAGATLTVFEPGAARQVGLGTGDAPTMTVYTAAGPREVALTAVAPAGGGRAEGGYFRLSSGYRHDKTSYNIASDASGRATPNVLSELAWEMPNAELRLDAGWTHASGFTLRGHLAYARTFSSGRVQDSDYLLDDRQGEFSRSYSDPKGSTAHDYSFGIGWLIPVSAAHDVTPMIGLARYAGKYRMRDGKQIIPALGPIVGLDNTYEPEWRSGWIGLESELRADERLSVRTGLKHHWFSYEAVADWNLRSERAHPVSFRHLGHGTGWEADIDADWSFLPQHSLSFGVSARKLSLKNGRRILYSSDGSSKETQLNGVDNDSWALRLGYRFDY